MQLRTLRTVEGERALRVTSERQAHENARLLASLQERQELLERLTRIQRSISHRAPLQEVLDAVTTGARNLLGDDMAALRLIDPDDPGYVVMASHSGIRDDLVPKLKRGPANEGVGGRAVLERRLVIIDDYSHARDGIPAMKEDRLQAAMAAPVYENGEIAGGLLTASYRPGRRYSKEEQDALLAFADHASLALTDAKTVEAMRSAQRAKDMFLAMVSHELKTPLTVILGSLDTFRRHPELDTTLRAEMTQSAYERANELATLIDRLLKGARGELSSQREEVALPDLVARAMRGFEHTSKVVVGDVPDVVCHVDPRLVGDVLGVFLENAVAHSPHGSEIYVDAGVDDGDVTLTVANAGSLPAGLDTAQLFLPFQRGHDASSSGVGLGLYIAARLARSAGGTIDVGSSRGRVSFTLRLPLHAERLRAPQAAAGD
jgi:signal transduction histidine kinase